MAQGVKSTKRAGWPGPRRRRREPERAARRWLAVVVATVWRRRVGGAAEETMPARTLRDVTGWCPERPRTRRATRLRLVRVLRQGWVVRLVAWLRHDPWPQGLSQTPGQRYRRGRTRRASLLWPGRKPHEGPGERN